MNMWHQGDQLPLTFTVGRNLVYDSRNLPRGPRFSAIMSNKYFVFLPDHHEIVCGSTYEHNVNVDISSISGELKNDEIYM